jgi:hypothetical protein
MSDDLRTAATFATPTDAAIARNALEAAGIDAVIADELTLTADPFLSSAIGFIKVQVREADFERAATVLADHGPTAPADAADDLEPPAADGSDDFLPVSPGERSVEFAYRAAVMGIIACPPLLHVYSLGLLLWIAAVHGDLPPAANRRWWVAFAIDIAVLSVAALLVKGIIFRD